MDEVPVAFDKLVKGNKYHLESEKYSGDFTVTGDTQTNNINFNNRLYATVNIEFDDINNLLNPATLGSKEAVLCSTTLNNNQKQIRFYFKQVPTFNINDPIEDGKIVLNPMFVSTITEKTGGGKRRHKKSRKVRRNRRNKTYRKK